MLKMVWKVKRKVISVQDVLWTGHPVEIKNNLLLSELKIMQLKLKKLLKNWIQVFESFGHLQKKDASTWKKGSLNEQVWSSALSWMLLVIFGQDSDEQWEWIFYKYVKWHR